MTPARESFREGRAACVSCVLSVGTDGGTVPNGSCSLLRRLSSALGGGLFSHNAIDQWFPFSSDVIKGLSSTLCCVVGKCIILEIWRRSMAAAHGGTRTWAWGWALPALTRGCPAAAFLVPAIELSFFKGAAAECCKEMVIRAVIFQRALLLWLQRASNILKIIWEWYLKKSLKAILKTRSDFMWAGNHHVTVLSNECGAKLSTRGGTDSLPPCTELCCVTSEHLCSPASSVSCGHHLPSWELGKKCEKQGRWFPKGSESELTGCLLCPVNPCAGIKWTPAGGVLMSFLGSRPREAELGQLWADRTSQAGLGLVCGHSAPCSSLCVCIIDHCRHSLRLSTVHIGLPVLLQEVCFSSGRSCHKATQECTWTRVNSR